jgi:hypothetical protein
MASTPLYKFLKQNGTSFYAFPGAAEDISAAYQNSNYKMYFSKYALLNFPKQSLPTGGTISKPIYFDFENAFSKTSVAQAPTNFKDAFVESLRNYVANNEVVLRESRLNNTKYYYDTNALETTTEKIFFKWCKKLNLIGFEPAIPEDEYFSTLGEFQSKNINDDEYFPEFLWKEREVKPYEGILFYETGSINPQFLNKLEVEFVGTTNFKVGDIVNVYDIADSTTEDIFMNAGYNMEDGLNIDVLDVIPAGATQGQKIIFDIDYTTTTNLGGETIANFELVYHRLVQYIGEVNGISNVQEANRSYTEVYAHIPDHTGKTPDILFRLMTDVNYKPGLSFPILPSQYQSEILGAENFTSPIVSSPLNYPGSYFGQFDTLDYTYETSNGDTLRRSGDYFGVAGDINNPIIDGSTVDGVGLDFNINHYVKMNIPRRILTNFDQFNAQSTNNLPPEDFEFNAILWYYTVEDSNGNSTTNVYGVSLLDNPDNNVIEEETSLRFPTYKKLVSNGKQDGTSYAFSLNLNFNIINENIQEAYNPQAINSLFSMNLFNDAMTRLASLNDSFSNIIGEQVIVRDEINNLKSLLYTQTDINVLNNKISNLETLLRLYSTLQIQSSSSIEARFIAGTPPRIELFNIDPTYTSILNYFTSDMYDTNGIIPLNTFVTANKSILINIQNNDEVEFELPNNEKLTLILDRDLSYKQSVDIVITGSEFASQNKKLDIFMNSDYTGGSVLTEILLVGDIDLPVYYNTSTNLPNSAYLWKNFNFDIDFNQEVKLLTGERLELSFEGNTFLNYNSIKVGETVYLNNFFVGTSSVYNFSGQYTVDSLIGNTSSVVIFDISSNKNLVSYGSSASLPLQLHSSTQSLLSNTPYFSFNKGKKIKITRVSNSSVLNERYKVQIDDIM